MMEEVRIAYTLKQNDNLLKVAQCFETTVDKILSENKHIKPTKLNVGEVITVVPGSIHNFRVKGQQENTISQEESDLSKLMRMRWEEHIFWTRAAIISILENLGDRQAVVRRLLQNPEDIAMIFSPYYSPEVVQAIEALLTDHLTIAANLVTALKNGDEVAFERYNKEFYANADSIAEALAGINANYDVEELRKMLYTHLDLVIRIAAERHNKNYVQEIRASDDTKEQILMMADMLTQGLVKAFPDKF